jgi:hypothetical protein
MASLARSWRLKILFTRLRFDLVALRKSGLPAVAFNCCS